MTKQDINVHLRTMFLILIVSVFAFLLSSCGVVKKHKQYSKSDTSSVAKIEIKNDIKTDIKITEEFDTVVTLDGSKVKASKQLDNLIAGDSIVAESNGLRIKTKYNPKTKIIESSAEKIPVSVHVKGKKTTEFHQADKSKVKAKVKSAASSENNTVDVKKRPSVGSYIISLLSLGIMILIGLWSINKYIYPIGPIFGFLKKRKPEQDITIDNHQKPSRNKSEFDL